MSQNTYILTRPRAANFACIIKIETMFIKTTFKDIKKVKRIKIYALIVATYICISWYYKICWLPVRNADVSRYKEVCHEVYMFFWIFFRQRIPVPNFIIVEYVHQIFLGGEPLAPPPNPWAARKRLNLNRFNKKAQFKSGELF